MDLENESLRQAQHALSVFDGIHDSFGAQLYSSVSSGIVAELSRSQNGREECSCVMGDLTAALNKCQEMLPS